ncbi:hypothetical protein ECANGB1_1841 [Enterospora canceri]|uniref:Uncharacterized protein n=1 Tax=Enterospora canceri TaxID=1081671 RepID=A0A1Y1S5G5_9MICR|nr:hypothetical protein ECANGB1_1841 [Enterospora canceri]
MNAKIAAKQKTVAMMCIGSIDDTKKAVDKIIREFIGEHNLKVNTENASIEISGDKKRVEQAVCGLLLCKKYDEKTISFTLK